MFDYDYEEFEPQLWDANPDVCCAAFQLGACAHTESDLDYEEENDSLVCEFWPDFDWRNDGNDDEPF